MNLTIQDGAIQIQLTSAERLWAFHLSHQIEIPLDSIQSVRLERPATTWKELRAPGTHLPGLIKAGTYYTERGREFWYAQGDQNCLCLDIAAGYYKRIVLSSAAAERWRSQLQQAISL
ncbi:MAG: hypothetical protein WBB01_07515 [Phormidesmis sp.]